MASSRMTDCVAELIGPNVKLHHTKINSKLPGGATAVKWHQDFPFTPHSNDDVVTALLMVDDVTEENGPLEVVAGSHTGAIHGLWHDGVFTGSVADDVAAGVPVQSGTDLYRTGRFGLSDAHSVVAWISAEQIEDSRTLFISVYSAEDAVPYSPNPVPTKYEGLVVRVKKRTRFGRCPMRSSCRRSRARLRSLTSKPNIKVRKRKRPEQFFT